MSLLAKDKAEMAEECPPQGTKKSLKMSKMGAASAGNLFLCSQASMQEGVDNFTPQPRSGCPAQNTVS